MALHVFMSKNSWFHQNKHLGVKHILNLRPNLTSHDIEHGPKLWNLVLNIPKFHPVVQNNLCGMLSSTINLYPQSLDIRKGHVSICLPVSWLCLVRFWPFSSEKLLSIIIEENPTLLKISFTVFFLSVFYITCSRTSLASICTKQTFCHILSMTSWVAFL